MAGEYHWAFEGSKPVSGSKPAPAGAPAAVKAARPGASKPAPPRPSSQKRPKEEKPVYWKPEGVGMADDDESEVPVSPVRPYTPEEQRLLSALENVSRNKKGDPTNSGLAVTKIRQHYPGDGLLKTARQPDRYVRTPSGAPRAYTPPVDPYEEVDPVKYPGLLRKVRGNDNIGELYLRTLAHPGLPKEENYYIHRTTKKRMTPEEAAKLQAHFLSTKTPGVEVTEPHLNSAGRPTTSAEMYPHGIDHVSAGYYRVGYDKEKADPSKYRVIRVKDIYAVAPYTSQHTSGKNKKKLEWVSINPNLEPEIATSNMKKTSKPAHYLHQHVKQIQRDLENALHTQTKKKAKVFLSNEGEGEGMSSEELALGGARRRSWRSYAYRKLGLPKFGLDNEDQEAFAHEEVKKKYTPHQVAAMAIREKDPKTARGLFQVAGDLAGDSGEEEGVGMAATSGSGAPPAPTPPKTGSIGAAVMKKVGGSVGKAVGRAALGSAVQGVANEVKGMGSVLGFSNDRSLSDVPSSVRVTRSPGQQILFNLRQKKGK